VPTTYHRAGCMMAGTQSLSSARVREVICLRVQAQSPEVSATRWHDSKSLLIFRNHVKPRNQKYSASVLTQISHITPSVSPRMRGARERHERAVRCDGRRWCERRCAPEAYGEVVWSGRRGAGVKSERSESYLRAMVAKEPFTRESTYKP
jgi:hypothetical protein